MSIGAGFSPTKYRIFREILYNFVIFNVDLKESIKATFQIHRNKFL